jgi:hypothetical protein
MAALVHDYMKPTMKRYLNTSQDDINIKDHNDRHEIIWAFS